MKTLRSIQLLLMAGVLSQSAAAAAGDPLDQWHEFQMTGRIPNLQTIRYAQGKWLGLHRDGSTGADSLVTSIDGRNWTIHTTFESSATVTDLDFASGLWLAVGTCQATNVFVLTSTNAVDWNSSTLPRGAGASIGLWRIRRSPTEWILLANASCFRSPDGRSWTASQLSPPWLDIVYGDGHWVAIVNEWLVGDVSVGSLAISTNLTDWQWWSRPALPLNRIFYSLKCADGLWFGVTGDYWTACSAGTSVFSWTGGTNWITPRFSAPSPGQQLDGQIILVNNRLLASASMPWGCGVACPGCPPPPVPIFESAPLISLEQNQPGELIINRAAGIPVAVESTDDLRQWHTLTNLPLGQAVQPFTDPTASSLPARFYRARTP